MTIRAIGIHASAGTGKTHRLTNELISLFLQGHPPQSVFAATFTRAAAGEILDRVLRRLVAAAADPKGLAELRIALQNPDLSAAECRRIAASLARSIDRVAVWTIDSFLVRVATAFSVEIGLSPGWRIAGDDEDKRLRRAAVDRVLREGGREVIGPLLRMLKKSEGERSVRQSLIDVVNAVYAAQAGAAPQAWHAVVPAGDEMSSEDIARAVEAFGAAGLPVTRSGEPNKNWTKGRARAVEVARRHDWEGFLDSGFVGKFRSEGCYYQIPFPEGLAEPLRNIVRHAEFMVVREIMHRNLAAAEIARRFADVYERMKMESGSLLFDDIPRLLAAERFASSSDEMYYRLDASIGHVLLDEFQDTSVGQFNVVRPIIAEIISDETRPRTFFYVGDAKQSLYGWRDAEPALLGHIGKQWPQVRVEPLSSSYRSTPPVIDAVNAVFDSLQSNPAMTDDAARAAAADMAAMYSSHSVSGKAAVRRGQVVLREYPPILGDTRDKDALVMARCEFIARRVATIRDASPRASIGVLVRNKVSVSRLLMALSEEGVDATEEGGSSITQSPAVAAVVSLLRLADHPGDTLAAFHVATTPLGDKVGLSRRQDAVAVAAVSQAIREQITRHGFGQVVSQWVRWLAPACSEIDRTRLAQVSLAAWEHERRGGASIRGLISLIEATRRPVGVPSLVRVMTTHAAKGLEFDAVVAPDLDGIVPQRTPEVLAWRDDLLGPITRLSLNAAECVRRSNPILSALADDRRRRDIREGLCLLYVTMTRARHYLEMIIHRPPKEESTAFRLAHVVRYALGGEADEDGLIHSSGSEQWPCDVEPRPSAIADRPTQTAIIIGMKADGQEVSDAVLQDPDREDEIPVPVAGGRSARLAKGIGTALHACLERVTWIEDELPTDEELLFAIERADLPFDVDPRRLVDRARRVLCSPGVMGVITRARYLTTDRPGCTVDLLREISGAVLNGDGSVVHARIDRLAVVRRDGVPVEAEVLDWKSDAFPEDDQEPAIERRVAYHQPQLEAYRLLVSRHLGLPPARVRATVVFTSIDRAVTIGPA